MPSYDNRNTEIPTAGSVRGMWIITGLVGLLTASIVASGGDFDWKHGTGFLLGILATALIAMQAGNRMVRRDAALWEAERQEQALRAARAVHDAETGTWQAQDGAEAYIAWMRDRQCYALGGSLPLGTEPGFVAREEAHSAGLEMERAGYQPSDDDGTRSVRARLMLPGWYVGS